MDLTFDKETKFADFHVHLGSMVSAASLWDIAHMRGLKLPTTNFYEFVESMEVVEKLAHKKYLDKFTLIQQIQSSPEAIERCVYEAISLSYRKANINLLELRFNPMLRNQTKFYNLDSIILHALIGMKKAMLVYPVKCGLIIETDRTFSGEQSSILAEKAVKFKTDGVVGFDMSGFTSKDFNYKDHITAFRKAKSGGLGITCHAGEVDDAELMNKMIDEYKPDRIGHGIAAYSDDKLKQKLKEENICLEICPTSNEMTKVVDSFEAISMIIKDFNYNGIPLTINSDGPVFLGTNVVKEYRKLRNSKGFGDTDGSKELNKIHAATEKFSFLNGFRANW